MSGTTRNRLFTGLGGALALAVLATGCSNGVTPAEVEVNFARGDNGNNAGGMAMVQIYEADLMPLNNSGVTGTARFMVVNGELQVRVHAKGLTPNMVHPQHIHGFGVPTMKDAVCPPMSAAGPDQLLTLEEGFPFYGAVLVPLDSNLEAPMPGSFPMANRAGVLNYNQMTSLPIMTTMGSATASMLDLEQRAVVLHGMFVDGTYVATLPVACGEIRQVK